MDNGIEGMFYILLILTLSFSYLLLKIVSLKFYLFTLPNAFLIYFITASYIGIVGLFNETTKDLSENYFAVYGITDPILVIKLLCYASICLALTIFGFIIAKALFKKSVKGFSKKIEPLKNEVYYACLAITSVCILVIVLFVRNLEMLPIFAIFNESDQIRFLRSEATNNFSGKYHYYGVFMDVLLPYVSYILFSQSLLIKNRLPKVVFFMVLLIIVFQSIMLTLKAKVILYLLSIICVYFISKNKSIKVRHLFWFISLSVFLLFFMYLFFMQMIDRDFLVVFQAIANRAFVSQIVPAYFYLDFFPEHHNFLWGTSFPNPGGIFPWESYRLTVEIMDYIFPDLAARGIVGSAPTAYWAELYANFGLMGVIVISPFVGFFLYSLQLCLERLQGSPVVVAFIVWSTFHFMKLAVTGISIYIFDIKFLSVLILTWFLLLLQNKRIKIT